MSGTVRDGSSQSDEGSRPLLPAVSPSRRRTDPASTADHFVRLFLTLGVADDPAPVSTPVEGIGMGNSIRSIQVV